uniref:EGF-like domain-containing protein n=1 Tax=Ciona savignyi TaxID=51511 RepID=H2YNB3_CIOSA
FAENCSTSIGYACERRVNGASLCASSPCANGGVCTESGCHFHCTCQPNFSGSNCEISRLPNTATQALNPVLYIIPICGVLVVLVIILVIVVKKRIGKANKDQVEPIMLEQPSLEGAQNKQEAVYENLAVQTNSESHSILVAQLQAMLKDMYNASSSIYLVPQFKQMLETA